MPERIEVFWMHTYVHVFCFMTHTILNGALNAGKQQSEIRVKAPKVTCVLSAPRIQCKLKMQRACSQHIVSNHQKTPRWRAPPTDHLSSYPDRL